MVGQKFGKWTVQGFSHKNKQCNSLYHCVCDCGTTGVVINSSLRHGNSTQCKRCACRINGRKGLNAQSKEHLYFIKCGEYIKIGSTDNIDRRVKDLRNSNPYPVELIMSMVGQGHREADYHELYKEHRVHGEWFKMNDCNKELV
jgi:mRNA-degrading endonuclease YafQ of YafQ-DinJ toxin-antitoxin module